MMPSWGTCAFCGQLHELGDARTDENCALPELETLLSRGRTHAEPLDERLAREDGEPS